jgi:hypothetical protein
MKHLIPYLQDDQKAADYLRQVRWVALHLTVVTSTNAPPGV